MRTGSVLGHILGGDDLDEGVAGELAEVIGSILGAARGRGRALALPPKPAWRNTELAPGVHSPDEGMVPLPLQPLQNGGVFSATVTSITYQGQLQEPFRAERLLALAARTGASATGRILGLFFIGTRLNQADIFGLDVELIGGPGTFGSRMTMHQAPPGVLIRVLCTISTAPTGTDTVALPSMIFLGRNVH
jgi:hypothetical protein